MANARSAQVPPDRARAGNGPARSARLRGVAAGAAASSLLPLVVGAWPAAADDYAYTGSCSVTTQPPGELELVTRTFRARVPRTRSGNRWNLGGYDYWYQVPSNSGWGPHSDEELTITHGRIDGPSPWHSPDEHTTNVAWVAERGWKGSSSVGASQIKFHAWFDIPRVNDPECNAYTATF